jgi:exopolysaccharide biosynthesis glucuronosyltransferase PssE
VIFVTVGSMFPFDRLIRVMDAWAAEHSEAETLAQIGDGAYQPSHMPWVRRFGQAEFVRTMTAARLIVAHAGMGSVITADEFRKPIVLLPRLQERGEHNTDHQVATANWLRGKPGVHVADRDEDLASRIAEALAAEAPEARFAPTAGPDFIARIRACILS